MEKLDAELAELNAKRDVLMKRWNEEKDILAGLQTARQEMENYKIQAASAERAGDYGKVAELRYGKMVATQKTIDELTAKAAAIKEPIVTEAVTPEDIAEVVAKWTGIPVKRMLESEKEKLLRMEAELHKRVVGQDRAIQAVSDAVRRNRAGLSVRRRPPQPRGPVEREAAHRLVPVHGHDRRRQDRTGEGPGGVPVQR